MTGWPADKKASKSDAKKRAQSNGAKTNADSIASKEKMAAALTLRKEGKTFTEIAKELGYKSKQTAHEAVKRAIREIIREPAEDVIRLDLERLDAMWQVNYLNAQAGDPVALASCMRIMERRAKLLGLDAPTKVAETDPYGSEKIQQPTTINLVPVRPAE